MVAGSGFLWHQIRCIVALLILIGQGKEEISLIPSLLDIERYPSTPNYQIASGKKRHSLVFFPEEEIAFRTSIGPFRLSIRWHWMDLWPKQSSPNHRSFTTAMDLVRSARNDDSIDDQSIARAYHWSRYFTHFRPTLLDRQWNDVASPFIKQSKIVVSTDFETTGAGQCWNQIGEISK